MKKWSAVIPAAGSGVRLGSEIPKPFIEIRGKTILEHTLLKFTAAEGLIQIIVATSGEYISTVEKIFDALTAQSISLKVVEGSRERQLSISNALPHISEEAELVAIHDAVRPFVTVDDIEKCCDVAADFGGAVLGVPAKDTIKMIEGNQVIKSTPDRNHLWQAQTPQVFQKKLIMEAYKSAQQNNYLGTDDASLVERIGGKIKMVEGARENLKITYPIDLKIAELLLS